MRLLVIGTGSIGARHIENLCRLLPTPELTLWRSNRREDDYSRSLGAAVVDDLYAALRAAPELAVIATPSSLHFDPLRALLAAGVPCYVEKPVVATEGDAHALEVFLSGLNRIPATLCGCNLRFLPSLLKAREIVQGGALGRVVRASLQVGQWLPDWRPGVDYRTGYSAQPTMGGGVVLDLIHELDAARWLFGDFDIVHAVGGHYSALEIGSEDAASIILGRAGGPAISVGLDYVARRPIRRYEFVGEAGTLVWDLTERALWIDASEGRRRIPCEAGDFDLAQTYITAMEELLCAMREGRRTSQDIFEGLRSVRLALRIKRELEL